ncbi:MAG: TRAP transporter substrate-binding protein DctP [Thermodesulfobacteriota bacterium]
MKKAMIALIGACVVFLAGQVSAEPITLKFSTVVPPKAHPASVVMKPWSDMVTKESNGALKIELYPGGLLGSNVKMYFQQIESGVFDIALIYPGYFGDRFIDLTFPFIPFTAETYIEGALALQRMTDRGLIRGFEGFQVLMNVATSPFYANTTFPLRMPEDFKGRKMRSGNQFQAKLLPALGSTPFDIPVNKSAESMSRGLVEGTIESPSSITAFGGDKVAKHHLRVPMGSSVLSIVMGKAKYESLPPQAKSVIDKFKGEFFSRYWAERLAPFEDKEVEAWKKSPDHTVVVPSAAEMDAWKKAIQPIIDDYLKDNPKLKELLQIYHEELAKVRAGR